MTAGYDGEEMTAGEDVEEIKVGITAGDYGGGG